MSRLRAADVESAREAADVEADALCFGLSVAIPVLRELRPRLEAIGRDAIPGFIRWLLGGLVDDVVGGLIKALEDWRDRTCTEGETP